MTIKKFQGRTESEASEKAKKELGENCVIMNVKEIKPKGFLSAFKSSTFEVTAAVEEKEKSFDPSTAFKNMPKAKSVNVVANEKIEIPSFNTSPVKDRVITPAEPKADSAISMFSRTKEKEEKELEQKISNLQSRIDDEIIKKEIEAEDKAEEQKSSENRQPTKLKRKNENFEFIKTLYEVLIENEVDEKYVNQIMDEMEKVNWGGNNVDTILSAVYQKMILKFGQPKGIDISKKPSIVFFIGPTGVGKTTTIAKIASKYKIEKGKKVAFLAADTYRIAAAEQLRTYANILDSPMKIVYSPEELNGAIDEVKGYDLVLVDTAGLSHKNETQRADVKNLIDSVDEKYNKAVYLVISATTKYKDLLEITDTYKEISDYNLVFTKLDETSCYGNLLNIKLHTGAALSYVTTGQNVPDDIEVFDTQKIVKQLLGGR
ncbi:MAG: flagellar biosynthesis protein FlhF [Lachnospiraceae bacterium]|nr:flagellar biosynthesis protein FlhF [Lachnospiraceae bacterium]